MTRADREYDIADYLRYLDLLCAQLRSATAHDTRLTAFGFSQGTATVSRWAAATVHALARLILWGSLLPPDLDWTEAEPRLQRLRVTLVVGDADAYVSLRQLADQEAELAARGIQHQTVRFKGGHQLNEEALQQVSSE
jgi:predicted esterase